MLLEHEFVSQKDGQFLDPKSRLEFDDLRRSDTSFATANFEIDFGRFTKLLANNLLGLRES